MLRSNLATRPFYNERLVALVIGAVALVAVVLTAFNVTRIVSLTRERGAVRSATAADRLQADRVAAHAAALQQGVDRDLLLRLANSTHEANDLIDQRTFSWSTLFSHLEKTMPFDVRLVSVTPRTDKDGRKISMTIIARNLDDITAFVDNLTNTGAFYDVRPAEKQVNDANSFTALVEASYVTARPAPAPEKSTGPPVTTTPSQPAAAPPRDAAAPAGRGGRR